MRAPALMQGSEGECRSDARALSGVAPADSGIAAPLSSTGLGLRRTGKERAGRAPERVRTHAGPP